VELIPLPVLTAAMVQYRGDAAENKGSQEVLLYPVGATFFDGALEGLVQASQLIKLRIAEVNVQEDPDIPLEPGMPKPISQTGGCPRVSGIAIPELMDFILSAVRGNVQGEYLPAVEYGHTCIAKFMEVRAPAACTHCHTDAVMQ